MYETKVMQGIYIHETGLSWIPNEIQLLNTKITTTIIEAGDAKCLYVERYHKPQAKQPI